MLTTPRSNSFQKRSKRLSTLSKQSLLEHTDIHAIIDVITKMWLQLSDEDEQELCLETIYELLADTAPTPEDFSLLSNDDKAQYEIDIDMVLINVDFKDIGKCIFDDGENERYFWSKVGDRSDKKNKKIYAALFSS